MSEFKGTKGEWRIESIEGSCSLFIESNSGCLGTVWSNSKTEANAKLIAAAPDMLEALQKIASNSNDHAMIRIAIKAINKALK